MGKDIIEDLFIIFERNIQAKIALVSANIDESFHIAYSTMDLKRQMGAIEYVLTPTLKEVANEYGGSIELYGHTNLPVGLMNPDYYDFMIMHGTQFYDARVDHYRRIFPNGRYMEHCFRVL